VKVVAGDAGEFVRGLRARPGKDVWLFGGGELFRSLLEAGQVDAVEVAVVPVLLGGGVPLLPTPGRRVKLKLENSRVYTKTGTVSLEYSVEYASGKSKARAGRAAGKAR
jgi:dihydrofolate reductase